MTTEHKRVFISDLPETFTGEELEHIFSDYGQVSSVEIKERKELGPNNKSLFFAYINLQTDDKSLNQCFRNFSKKKWHGQYVQLQMARESFLERLKRERQESERKQNNSSEDFQEKYTAISINKPKAFSKRIKSPPESEADSSESDSSSELKHNHIEPRANGRLHLAQQQEPPQTEKLDIIVKSNKNRQLSLGKLVIPSVGNSPIIEVTKAKSKTKQNDSEANKKRLQSLQNMKKGYAAQKSLIRNALAYGTSKPNKKIVFDDSNSDVNITNPNNTPVRNGIKKNSLFDGSDSDEDSEFKVDFSVKEQFQGKSGQKLLELQSRFKNDKRFALDERFMEGEEDDENMPAAEENFEVEKHEQLKILERVLGKKITPKASTEKESAVQKKMVKFDPFHPEHSSLELAPVESVQKKKKKDKLKKETEEVKEQLPDVSKEVFYRVSDKLKDSLAQKSQFSLLTFGKENESKDEAQEETEKNIKQTFLVGNRNSFKYESSDDEDEVQDIPHKDSIKTPSDNISSDAAPVRATQSVFWTEPFFFKHDDFRLQEGFDFIEKMKSESKEFPKIRRELKGIVRAKLKNTERKNKMFKKKLGGSKRKKHIRMKKALKR